MLEQMLKNMGVDLPAMQATARDFVARFEVVERQVKEIHAMALEREERNKEHQARVDALFAQVADIHDHVASLKKIREELKND